MKVKYNWNLTPLFKSDNDPKIEKLRASVNRHSNAFITKWANRSDYLTNPKTLKEALDDYEAWQKNWGEGSQEWYYFHLRKSLNETSPKIKARLNKIQEFGKKIENDIQFFTIKIAKTDKKTQKKFLSYKPLLPYKHFLERLFVHAEHLLSEPEEKLMNLKADPAHTNWVRMTNSFISKEERTVLTEPGKKTKKNFSDILGLLSSSNKKVRDSAADAFNDIMQVNVEIAENELNSILQDKKINDDLRGYKRPDSARHMADDMQTDVVDALTSTVTNNFKISADFYKLKAKLFGVEKLEYHERNVPYGKIAKKYTYSEAVTLADKVFSNLDQNFSDIFRGFVNGRIDVYPKRGKTGGAYCTYGLLTHPTYSLLNYTEKLNDVLTLAHEMGHGINFELIKASQNAINFGTTIATTEVASTFMEDFVLQELLEKAGDNLRLALMVMKLDTDISTIFRQVAFYNFEKELHAEFRKVGYLSHQAIGALFKKHMMSYMGPAVEQNEGSQNWWVYVSHFRSFFYVYSYASGMLIAKSLQASVKDDPEFILKVKGFLSAGLSDSPKNIFAKLGIDITKRQFWIPGIEEIKTLLDETEKLATKLGKI